MNEEQYETEELPPWGGNKETKRPPLEPAFSPLRLKNIRLSEGSLGSVRRALNKMFEVRAILMEAECSVIEIDPSASDENKRQSAKIAAEKVYESFGEVTVAIMENTRHMANLFSCLNSLAEAVGYVNKDKD